MRLKDAQFPANDAVLPDDGTSSPCVGPDGDVYIDNVRRVASLLDSLPHAESAIFGAGSYS